MVTAIASKKRNKKPLLRLSRQYDLLALAVVAALVAADQIAKELVRKNITSPFQLGLLQITHTTNTGSVFGLFPGSSQLIVAISLIVVPVLVVIHMKRLISHKYQKWGLILIVSGIVGNTIDRLASGFVTDFIYVSPWPAFNLADSFLFIGAVLLAAPYVLQYLQQLKQRLRK